MMESQSLHVETTIVSYLGWINLLLFLLLLAAVFLLQAYLSSRGNRWLGLILPVLSLFPSVFNTLSLTRVFVIQGLASPWALFCGFLLGCGPLAVLLLIYYRCRKKFRYRKEIDAMQIQDLD